MAVSKQRMGFKIAGLCFTVAGLLWTIKGDVPIGIMNIVMGMMIFVLGARKARRRQGTESVESNQPTNKPEDGA